MRLIKLGTIGVDGTEIKANASRHKAMSYDRMQKAERELKEQIDAFGWVFRTNVTSDSGIVTSHSI